MLFDDPNHRRRSIRLPEYDYANGGAYYITICTRDRACIFGEIVKGSMALNANGEIVKQELERTPEIRREITLDEWVIMPNHVHAIVMINGSDHAGADIPVGAQGLAPLHASPQSPQRRLFKRKPKSLSSFIAGFKSSVTTRINDMRQKPGKPVWQRSYYEHIIRNGAAYDTIKRYIIENPIYWETDDEYPRTADRPVAPTPIGNDHVQTANP